MENLDDGKKEKIVRDCIAQEEMWSMQFDRNSKLYNSLKKVKKVPRKKKVKVVKKKQNDK